MNQITIRGLGPEIEQKIRRMAKDRHQSINQVLGEIVRQKFEKKKQIPLASGLKDLAGTWSKKEGEDFLKAIKLFEEIDQELWR